MTVTISACLITRDGQRTVRAAIKSVRPHVDEICIFLAGESSDETAEIVEELADEPGAPIVIEQGVWRDDFSWAREESFAMASSDFRIYFDDDEVLQGGEHLRDELAECDILYIRGLELPAPNQIGRCWHGRAARRDVGAHWIGRVEELIDAPNELRWRVTNPRKLRFFECLYAHMPTETRHCYRDLIHAEWSETHHPRLQLNVAGRALKEGRTTEATALFEELAARDEFSFYRLRALELLEVIYRDTGRPALAKLSAMTQARIASAWEAASRAGHLNGWKGLRHVFEEYDRLDDPALADPNWQATAFV